MGAQETVSQSGPAPPPPLPGFNLPCAKDYDGNQNNLKEAFKGLFQEFTRAKILSVYGCFSPEASCGWIIMLKYDFVADPFTPDAISFMKKSINLLLNNAVIDYIGKSQHGMKKCFVIILRSSQCPHAPNFQITRQEADSTVDSPLTFISRVNINNEALSLRDDEEADMVEMDDENDVSSSSSSSDDSNDAESEDDSDSIIGNKERTRLSSLQAS